jgi:hypothetical protein
LKNIKFKIHGTIISLSYSGKNRLRVFQNRVLRKVFGLNGVQVMYRSS